MIRRVALLLAALFALSAPAQAQESEVRTISVEGSALRRVPNDTARFTATVAKRGRTASAALTASARTSRRVLSGLGALGIARADTRTSSVTVRRVFRREGRRRVPAGYEARNSVRVTVRDLSQVGDAIDAAVTGGATGVDSVTLFRANSNAVYREVLVEAFDDARAKAELLAAQAGATLGQALSISEASDDFAFEEGAQRLAAPAPDAEAEAPPIRPGRTTVEASVSVVFELTYP